MLLVRSAPTFALLVGLLAACGPAPLDPRGSSLAQERDPAGLHSIHFRHHRIEIDEVGAFTFTCHGLDGVERVEEGRIATEELEALLRGVRELGFFELDGSYSTGTSDCISEIHEVSLEGRTGTVRNYWPGGSREWLREDLGIEMTEERYAIHRGLSDHALRVDAAVGTEERLARLIAAENEAGSAGR